MSTDTGRRTKKLTVEMNDSMEALIEELTADGARSKSQAIRDAIAVLAYLERDQSRRLYLRSEDGSETELVLPSALSASARKRG